MARRNVLPHGKRVNAVAKMCAKKVIVDINPDINPHTHWRTLVDGVTRRSPNFPASAHTHGRRWTRRIASRMRYLKALRNVSEGLLLP